MHDQLTIVLEAMRRAQAKVAFYLEPGNRNAELAFKEIAAILDDPQLMEAVRLLNAPTSAPSVSPDFALREDEMVGPLPARGPGSL